MKRKLLTISLLCILSITLTGCSLSDLPVIGGLFGGKSTNKEVTLNVWGLWENPEVMNAVITKYKETHPNVTINYSDRSVLDSANYKEIVFSRIQQEEMPDIVMVHNSWVSGLANNLSPMPSSLMDAPAYANTFYPVATQSAVFNSKIYAIPQFYDGLALVYNKKHFEEIDQLEPPTAWEEFRRLASELTIRGEDNTIVRAGAAIGGANNIDFFSDILGLMFAQTGVTSPKNIDSTPAYDALSFYTNFVLQDHVWNDSFQEASVAFSQEKVSMIFVPSWNLLDIINSRPDMEIGVAPVPQARTDSPVSWGSFWMFAVPSVSKNRDAAWEFLNYLSTEEAQLTMFSNASKYRQYGAPYSVKSLGTQISTNPYLAPYVSSASTASGNEFAARAGNSTQTEALREAVNKLLNASSGDKDKITPETVLKEAKAKIFPSTTQ